MTYDNHTLSHWSPKDSDYSNPSRESIWRSQSGPMTLRNNDVWSNSGTLINSDKEEKDAKKNAKRNKVVGTVVMAAAGVVLFGMAIRQWEKQKETQRKHSKEEEKGKKDVQPMPGDY